MKRFFLLLLLFLVTSYQFVFPKGDSAEKEYFSEGDLMVNVYGSYAYISRDILNLMLGFEDPGVVLDRSYNIGILGIGVDNLFSPHIGLGGFLLVGGGMDDNKESVNTDDGVKDIGSFSFFAFRGKLIFYDDSGRLMYYGGLTLGIDTYAAYAPGGSVFSSFFTNLYIDMVLGWSVLAGLRFAITDSFGLFLEASFPTPMAAFGLYF